MSEPEILLQKRYRLCSAREELIRAEREINCLINELSDELFNQSEQVYLHIYREKRENIEKYIEVVDKCEELLNKYIDLYKEDTSWYDYMACQRTIEF